MTSRCMGPFVGMQITTSRRMDPACRPCRPPIEGHNRSVHVDTASRSCVSPTFQVYPPYQRMAARHAKLLLPLLPTGRRREYLPGCVEGAGGGGGPAGVGHPLHTLTNIPSLSTLSAHGRMAHHSSSLPFSQGGAASTFLGASRVLAGAGALLGSVIPFTLLVIMPVNKTLQKDSDLAADEPQVGSLAAGDAHYDLVRHTERCAPIRGGRTISLPGDLLLSTEIPQRWSQGAVPLTARVRFVSDIPIFAGLERLCG
jgi:hypothetical protein